jgi:hypothetical protein
LAFSSSPIAWSAEDSNSDAQDHDLLEMLAQLLRSEDRDERGLALQEVREGAAGESATRFFADLLPKLGTEAQTDLLLALADRKDAAARSAALQAIESPQERVRAAGLLALGTLGGPQDIPLLAAKAAAGADREKAAASKSLLRLPSEGLTPAILQAMPGANAAAKRELLSLLAVRGTADAMPMILEAIGSAEESVRVAAWAAAQSLAASSDLPALLGLLCSARSAPEQGAGQAAVLMVCRREPRASLPAVVGRLQSGPAQVRAVCLHGLAVIGGQQAMEALLSRYRGAEAEDRDEVVRLLAEWPDRAALPHLLSIAQESGRELHRILALRGAIRLASEELSSRASLEALDKSWRLAPGIEEKRLILGALSEAASPAGLSLARRGLEEPELLEEAALAVLTIVEKLPAAHARESRAALEHVLAVTQNADTRKRAEQLSLRKKPQPPS